MNSALAIICAFCGLGLAAVFAFLWYKSNQERKAAWSQKIDSSLEAERLKEELRAKQGSLEDAQHRLTELLAARDAKRKRRP